MSIDKHINEAIKLIGDDTVNGIQDMKFEDLIRLHHNIGRKIRNGLKLWMIDINGEHPDNYSQKIIEEIWKIKNVK